jgi:hypothetical protein
MSRFPLYSSWFFRLTSVLLFAALTVYSQGGLGTVRGTVTDRTGAVVPGAKIAVTNVETNLRTEAQSDSSGVYQVFQLRPGIYELAVEAAGFKRLSRQGILVQVADNLTVDLSLEVGGLSESVTVTGDAPLIRTADAQTGEVINNALISNLPQLQRDPLRLLVLAGNVQGGGTRAQPGSDTRINGGRTVGVEYKIDGITAGTGLGHKVVDMTPTMETVAEFKVITNGISAEYGRLSGGAVELITKGGTNQFHGQLFEYFQNDHLNANSWQQNALGGTKPKFSQNIYGGVVGGPVWIPKVYKGTSRTFFFFNYEGMHRRQAGTLQVASVPTEMERRGDFSQTFYNGIRPTLYDQWGPVRYDAATNQYIRQNILGDGKRIPLSLLSPVSVELLKFVPLPNREPASGSSAQGNYIAPRNDTGERDMYGVRLDHNFTDSHRFFGRFTIRDSESGQTRWRGPASRATQNRSKEGLNVTLNHNWMISPSMTMEFRGGLNHWPNSAGGLLDPSFSSGAVPFDPITRSLTGTNNVPLVRAAGNPTTIFTENATANITNYSTYDTGITLTKILGQHTLRTGFQMYKFYDNFSAAGSGTFSFHAGPVHEIAGVDFGFGSDVSIAYATAAYMVGTNNQAELIGGTTRANAFNYYAGFIQDDLKLTPRLTLNLGLRWDMESPVTERHDKLYFWDPDAPAPFRINSGYNWAAELNAAGIDPSTVRTPAWVSGGFLPGALRIANTPEFPSRKGNKYIRDQFAPRIGAAYQLTPKTVLRGSFALMYMPTTGAEVAYSGSGLPLADSASAGWHASTDNMITLYSNWQSPFLEGQYVKYNRTNTGANFGATGPTSPAGFSRIVRMPKEYTFSFGVQRELKGNMVVEGTYNGNLGRELLGPDMVGRFPRDLFTGGPQGDNLKLYTKQIASPTAGQTQNNSVVGPKQNLAILQMAYPYFGAIAVQGVNLGRSNFHALNLRVEKRMSMGLSFLGNYTFSKLLDDVGGPNVALGINNTVLGAKRQQNVDAVTDLYGLSTLDETHVFRFAANYQLPVGRGKHWLSSPQNFGMKVLDGALGGWELAGMGTIRSGRPVTLVATTPNINNNVRVEWTYGSFADPNNPTVDNPAFNTNGNVFYSTRDPLPDQPLRRFFNAVDAKQFTYGTLPPIFPRLRHPGNYNYDVSLMKSFFLTRERGTYLQLRLEGNNFFNIRGYGNYNTTIGTRYFGMITDAGNAPRNLQVSMRLIF